MRARARSLRCSGGQWARRRACSPRTVIGSSPGARRAENSTADHCDRVIRYAERARIDRRLLALCKFFDAVRHVEVEHLVRDAAAFLQIGASTQAFDERFGERPVTPFAILERILLARG